MKGKIEQLKRKKWFRPTLCILAYILTASSIYAGMIVLNKLYEICPIDLAGIEQFFYKCAEDPYAVLIIGVIIGIILGYIAGREDGRRLS